MLNFGDEVEDIASGFRGIVTSRSEFMSGCTRYGVQPKVTKEGTLPQTEGFDENQLRVIKKAKVARGKGDDGGPERKVNIRH
jgi:hypothetical protein